MCHGESPAKPAATEDSTSARKSKPQVPPSTLVHLADIAVFSYHAFSSDRRCETLTEHGRTSMKTSEIRKRFIDFFVGKDHVVIRSDSLVPPEEDKSILFTGFGMNQFKNEFMGRGRPGLKRAVTSQKCLRTADIEMVGRSRFHHTFFEMLGNFSFGDYFKKESIIWAWEFLLEELKLPSQRLQASVYEEDDEAFAIWEKEIGLSPSIIHRYDQHENFWPADAPKLGPNGLCGPCSEIFYDYGPDVGCRRETCNPACDCGRFCEIWNLVFQQFERKDGGVLDPLPRKNIDTGLGLERTAAVMQGKRTSFDIDIFVPIINAIEREAETAYAPLREKGEGIAFRRIADHARAMVFTICDGILPSNTGRGYVLRKLIRRAVLDGDRLGRKEPFLYRLVPVATRVMSDQYPELTERRENIAHLVRIEEERFHQTLDQGMGILQETIEKLRAAGTDVLPGEEAFRLFDTYGLPLDVTESVLADEGMKADHEAFEQRMKRQRELSRKGTKITEDIFGSGPVAVLKEQGCATGFEGYERDATEGKVLGIICGGELHEEISEGDEATIVLDRTTFYGEAGGEVGDTGALELPGVRFEVTDTRRSEGMFLHVGKLTRGAVHVGDRFAARPDAARRAAIRRNHTATHLMHHALREVLGKHAQQAGSLVAPDRLRFDFHHTQAVTPAELRLVEDKVNERILRNDTVTRRTMKLEEAKAEGATALFGEKYGDEVRLLDIGGYSKELCGGLHCSATGDIGFFKILAESSVAAGIRRIEAVTGMGAVRYVHEKEELIASVSSALGAPEARLIERAEQVTKQVKDLRKEIQKARRSAGPSVADYLKGAKEVGGARIVTAKLEDADANDLRALADALRQSGPSVALALGTATGGKVALMVALTKDLVERGLHAGKIAGKAARFCGGGGGGRPDMAQAGGKDPEGLDKALQKAADLIAEKLAG